MTANVIQGDPEKCFAVGMEDYLSKPVRTPDLEASLERWLTHFRLNVPEQDGTLRFIGAHSCWKLQKNRVVL